MPRFILNNIEWVLNMYTLLFLSGKTTAKNTKILKKPLISYTAMYQAHLHLAALKLHCYILLCMFLFCIAYVQKCLIHQIFWEMFKL